MARTIDDVENMRANCSAIISKDALIASSKHWTRRIFYDEFYTIVALMASVHSVSNALEIPQLGLQQVVLPGFDR
jgi:hypothetical protein